MLSLKHDSFHISTSSVQTREWADRTIARGGIVTKTHVEPHYCLAPPAACSGRRAAIQGCKRPSRHQLAYRKSTSWSDSFTIIGFVLCDLQDLKKRSISNSRCAVLHSLPSTDHLYERVWCRVRLINHELEPLVLQSYSRCRRLC
jgi:hypothetical protein